MARFLAIFYRYAAKFEQWRSGKPLTHGQRVAAQKEAAERDVKL